MSTNRHPIHPAGTGKSRAAEPPTCRHCGGLDGDDPGTASPVEPVPTEPDEPKLVFTVEEAASALGISRGLAYQLVKTGDIPTLRFGRRLLVPRARLAALLSDPQVGQC